MQFHSSRCVGIRLTNTRYYEGTDALRHLVPKQCIKNLLKEYMGRKKQKTLVCSS